MVNIQLLCQQCTDLFKSIHRRGLLLSMILSSLPARPLRRAKALSLFISHGPYLVKPCFAFRPFTGRKNR